MRICDTDSKFKLRSKEYGQSLIARSYKPCKVCKQFSEVTKVSRETVKQLLNIHKMIYKFEKYRTLMDSLKAGGGGGIFFNFLELLSIFFLERRLDTMLCLNSVFNGNACTKIFVFRN